MIFFFVCVPLNFNASGTLNFQLSKAHSQNEVLSVNPVRNILVITRKSIILEDATTPQELNTIENTNTKHKQICLLALFRGLETVVAPQSLHLRAKYKNINLIS